QPGERGDQQHGTLVGERDYTEQERRAGGPIHKPRQRDLLQPGAEDRDRLRDKEAAEIAVPQRPENLCSNHQGTKAPSKSAFTSLFPAECAPWWNFLAFEAAHSLTTSVSRHNRIYRMILLMPCLIRTTLKLINRPSRRFINLR